MNAKRNAPNLKQKVLTDCIGNLVTSVLLVKTDRDRDSSVAQWHIDGVAEQLGRGKIVFASRADANKQLAEAGYAVSDKPCNLHGDYNVIHLATQAEHSRLRTLDTEKWSGATPCYVRYGDLPPDGRSRNFADGSLERGISVFRGEVLPSGVARAIPSNHVLFVSSLTLRDRPLYIVEGREVGAGADGEPVLADCRIVRPLSDDARDVAPRDADTQTPSGASADPELAKALALIEKRFPQLPEAARQELRRHFDAAYARLGKSPRPEPAARDRSSKSVSRSGRGR